MYNLITHVYRSVLYKFYKQFFILFVIRKGDNKIFFSLKYMMFRLTEDHGNVSVVFQNN